MEALLLAPEFFASTQEEASNKKQRESENTRMLFILR